MESRMVYRVTAGQAQLWFSRLETANAFSQELVAVGQPRLVEAVYLGGGKK